MPYCFSRLSVKFEGHTPKKIIDFDPHWAFSDCKSRLTSQMAMIWCTKLEAALERCPIVFPRSFIKFKGRTGQKIADFDRNWAFPDCYSRFNSLVALKWCTKLNTVKKRCPIVFWGHPSNFAVTRVEKLMIWIQFEITRPVAAIKSLRFALFIMIPPLNYKYCPGFVQITSCLWKNCLHEIILITDKSLMLTYRVCRCNI